MPAFRLAAAVALAAAALAVPPGAARAAAAPSVKLYPKVGACATPGSATPRSLGTSVAKSPGCADVAANASVRADERYALAAHLDGLLPGPAEVTGRVVFAQLVNGVATPGYVDASIAVTLNGAEIGTSTVKGTVTAGAPVSVNLHAIVPQQMWTHAVSALALSITWRTGTTPLVEPTTDGTSYLAVPLVHSVRCAYRRERAAPQKWVGLPPATGVFGPPDTMTIATNRGVVRIAVRTAAAPCTANSFRFLASRRYFDGTSCHRLTTSGIFVLQCGDPLGDGTGGPGYAFGDENLRGATYGAGTVAMANAGPGTNGSQFFVVYRATRLPPSYTPFGTVTSGLSVVQQVAKGGDDGAYAAGGGHPNVPVTIRTLTVRPA